jgi:hypothetical protein
MLLSLLLEVMDKEASLAWLWFVSFLLGVGGFVVARYRHRWLLVIIPLALVLAWIQISEVRDPFVGPDILREAGHTYVVQSYLAVSIAVVLPLIGALVWRKRIFAGAT